MQEADKRIPDSDVRYVLRRVNTPWALKQVSQIEDPYLTTARLAS